MEAFFNLLLSAQREKESASLLTASADIPPVYYLQSQNGNLLSELASLAKDVEMPGFAREAFGRLDRSIELAVCIMTDKNDACDT